MWHISISITNLSHLHLVLLLLFLQVLLDTCSSFHMQEFQSFNMSATALASPVIYQLITLLVELSPKSSTGSIL